MLNSGGLLFSSDVLLYLRNVTPHWSTIRIKYTVVSMTTGVFSKIVLRNQKYSSKFVLNLK
jgi:hypothetical protein